MYIGLTTQICLSTVNATIAFQPILVAVRILLISLTILTGRYLPIPQKSASIILPFNVVSDLVSRVSMTSMRTYPRVLKSSSVTG